MVLIAENLHIISKTAKEAIVSRNDNFVLDMVKKITNLGFNTLDLNIGPAKGPVQGSMEYLTKLINKNFKVNFSFDSSNFDEIEAGFNSLQNVETKENSFLNSISFDEEKMKRGFEIALKNSSNIIALAFNPKTGIAKTSDERLEYCFSIFEKAAEEGIEPNKLYFDPLVLPVSAAQNQANIVIETLRMLKEGLGEIHTIIGLSNISNGCPKAARALVNRVFMVMCMGAGLDSAIIDGLDIKTTEVFNVVKENLPKTPLENLYCAIYKAIAEFEEIDDIEFDKNDKEQAQIIKIAKILSDKEIYSNNFYTL